MESSTHPPAEAMTQRIPNPETPTKAPRSIVYLEPFDTQESGASSSALIDSWQLIRGRSLLILFIAVLGACCGAMVALTELPFYQAKGTLEIQVPTDNAFGMQSGVPGIAAYAPDTYFQTQLKTLQSRSLRARVLQTMRETKLLNSFPRRDRWAAWRKALHLKAAKAAPSKQASAPEFEVRVRQLETSHVVEITCESPDPAFSAAYVNTMAQTYIQSHVENRWQSVQRTSDWLSHQLEALKQKVASSEADLQKYSASAGLLFTDDKDNVQNDQLKQIQSELSRAQADRVQKQSVYEVATAAPADSVPQVVDNDRLSGYRTKLTELRRELAELSSLYTPEHYRIVRVKAQIAEVETSLKRERDAIITRIKNEYEAAQRRERLLLGAYNTQVRTVSDAASKTIQYDILKREVDTNQQLYSALLQKVKESSVASAISVLNVSVMDPAEIPSQPFKPNMTANVLKGVGAGLLLAFGLVLGGDRINRSLRTPGEAQRHLKLPELGVIPSGESQAALRNGRPMRSYLLSAASPDGKGIANEKVELVTWQDSVSLIAESFRNALASILLSGAGGQRPRIILVTSVERGEGKSTTVSNLGIALAEINQRVLLIDADMRKPRMHHIFECSNSWGLSDLLMEKNGLKDSPIEALARSTEIENLYVLPSGPGTVSISNLFYSNRMAELLQRFRGEFDAVLIDTPPMLTVSDARILGRLADAAILVIRAGQTTRDAALLAKQRLMEDGIPVLGTILNRWDPKAKSHYGKYGYYSRDVH